MPGDGVAIVLPARHDSTRFPGKPLALIGGRPLIEWVYRRACQVRGVERVIVATDHEAIAGTVRAFGGEVVMTSRDHRTGTDRVAEVARGLSCRFVFNLQGDEPVFPPALVESMIDVLHDEPVDVVTACHPILRQAELESTNVVKLVMDRKQCALYFSREAIPHRRAGAKPEDGILGYRHIGIYGFTRESIASFAAAASTPLERAESLEQLRALENGMTIRVVVTEHGTVGVDVPEDVKEVEKALTTA